MKISVVAVFFLLFHACFGQQVNSTVTGNATVSCQYVLTYQPDSNSVERKSSVFTLFTGKQFSKFEEKLMLAHDSLLAVSGASPRNQDNMHALSVQMQKIPFPTFTYAVFKDLQKNEIDYMDRIGTNLYSYSESAKSYSWQMLPERKTISGYSCQQATTHFAGRQWIAWFARAIPITDGPYKFCGLPGLILAVSDTNGYYSFELSGLKNLAAPVPLTYPARKVTPTTKKEFVKGKADYEADRLNRLAVMGNTFTEAQKQAYAEKAKRRNNPLELR